MVCVCLVRGEGVWRGPIYSLGGRFLPYARMESNQVPWQLLLLEEHLDGIQARFGRPRGSADPIWQPLGLILLLSG